MHRIYLPTIEENSDGKIIISEESTFHYLKNVLRIKDKEEITIFDNTASEYKVTVDEILPEAKRIILQIKRKSLASCNPRVNKVILTIACAIPKKCKMDDIIDKLTQIGVDKIIPLETKRVIIKLDKNKKIARLKRWQKIAINASQQSQRTDLPIIEPIQSIKEVLSAANNYDLKMIPSLLGERKTLKEVLAHCQARNILVLIGPEGDFTDEEVNLAIKVGCIPVTLGSLVLRVETAAVTVASIIRHTLD